MNRLVAFTTALSLILPASLACAGDRHDPGSTLRAIGKVVYKFSGARDDGSGGSVGVSTVVLCSNIGSTATQFEFITNNYDTAQVDDFTSSSLNARGQFTYSTHDTAAFSEDYETPSGKILGQGTVTVRSTSLTVTCTAMIVDAASATPVGIELHGTRFSPITGTQE